MSGNQECGLANAIEAKLAFSVFSKKNFLPRNEFDALLTENNIKEALDKAAPGGFDQSLVEYITKRARKTFATLVWGDNVQRAVDLEVFGFHDDYLPIDIEGTHLTSLNGLSGNSDAWNWFRSWKQREISRFRHEQWIFLPFIFANDSTMEELHRDYCLPFIKYKRESEEGSFSVLYKATIHHAHQKVSTENLVIAIKELRNKEAGADQSELTALNLARQLQHPHIVPFVGGFRQASTSHLLFQWADGGNLRSYWSDEKNWSRDADLIRWTIEQIEGLIAALEKWHNEPSHITSNGRHGDLKPENILRSLRPDRGIFQIADLGLAKVHSLPTHARNKPSSTPGGTLRYRPPEIDVLRDDQRIFSRSYDMWGMGCIILEWIIWLVYGIDGLRTFYQQAFPDEFDAFWSRTAEGRPTNPVAVYWMKHMQNTCLADGEQCYSIALRDLLLFVENRLLVPDSAEQDTTNTYRLPNGGDAIPKLDITPASDLRLGSKTPKRAKSRDSCKILQEILSAKKDIANYMYNPKVHMNGPNGRGPSTRSGLLTPFPKSSSRQEQKSRDPIRLNHQRQWNGGMANTKNPYAIPGTFNVWITHFDNLFAKNVFGILEDDEIARLAPAHKTSFLSDPQFPDAMLKRYKGMRIASFEEIYEKYSQLEFTHLTDRSLGMAGIESRFATLFGKANLLWRRADLTKVMTKIVYPPDRQVLSWSWMAVTGSICFMDIPSGSVDWTPDLVSPFDDSEDTCGTSGALRGDARQFSTQRDDRLFFDRVTDGLSYGQLLCLVLGTQDVWDGRLMTHYGLLVATAEEGSGVYERVGVATFERDHNWMDREHFQCISIV
ncbi:hypothetical protein G6011_02407 [Alternaria panax]|uniref:Protein kinase domain-containing protein n=1 Tax=Alternaria panax TaxID=48097 RepID=A0AAD4FDH7_9PLEO|nr:hypothetical protein G6011_02407 [Alternaria panax]